MNSLYIRTTKTASSAIFVLFVSKLSFISMTNNDYFLSNIENQNILNKFTNRFTFTSIRHPYTRSISSYEYGLKEKWFDKISFSDFLNIDFTKGNFNENIESHCMPLSFYLKDVFNKINFTIKVENIQEDMNKLCNIFSVDFVNMSKIIYETPYDKNKIKNLLSEDVKNLIYKRYYNDFDMFKYTKHLSI